MAHKTTTGFPEQEIQLARFAKALGHPARIAILRQLANMNCCFCGDIVEELPLAQATVSQHLKELKESGLIQGNIEPPKVRYCIDPDNWKKARKLISDLFNLNPEISCES
ncbi:MAG: winged helix-turn-helix transcriptional regulator [Deltaproteobacteria bacterium]|nr:winged helix-turn-helix transcriptional regulator [Deltaproteobacteria bacterium]MBL7110827.1 winged helix-turn-helix transcriptional regulator [Bacteroidales bacterium]